MRKVITISFGLAVFLAPLPAFAGPPQSEIEGLGEKMGSVAADFETCDASKMAHRLKVKFERIAIICTEDDDGESSANNAFSQGYLNRLNDIDSQGFTCRGDNRSRYDTIMDGLDRLYHSCDSE